MAIITYPRVDVTDRKYETNYYTIERYTGSGKINLRVRDGGNGVFLKMSLEETKELITRLQFAVYEAENAND